VPAYSESRATPGKKTALLRTDLGKGEEKVHWFSCSRRTAKEILLKRKKDFHRLGNARAWPVPRYRVVRGGGKEGGRGAILRGRGV